MFEKEIKFISDFSLNKVKDLGSFITFEKLSSINLHPAILTYISGELDYMIFADRNQLLKDSMFDYSGKEISENFRKIANEIKKTKKVSFEDIKKLITQAVSFNVNYIVRPKWSLSKLVYNNNETVTTDDLMLILNYIYYYDYIKNVLTSYISKRQVVQFSATEFDLILNKIDRELFKLKSEDLINNALVSMGDFFNIGGIDRTIVPMAGVEILLKEKNLIDYLLKLHRAIPNDTKKKYDIEDIKKILYSRESDKSVEIGTAETIEEKHFLDIRERDEIIIETEDNLSTADSGSELNEVVRDKSEIVTEDAVDMEEVLPIEEEFIDDFISNTVKVSEPEVQQEIKEQTEKLIIHDETGTVAESKNNEVLENDFTSELNVSDSNQTVIEEILDIKDEETAQVDDNISSDTDELLAYYEKELAMTDDNPSDRTIPEDIPEEKTIQAEDDSGIQITEETAVVTGNNEVVDNNETTGEGNFDLSIFVEEENKDINPIESEQKNMKSDNEIPITNGAEEINQEKTKILTKSKSEQELTIEKEIVKQMMDDHDKNEGDEFNKEDQEEEYFDIIDEESTPEEEYSFTKSFGDEDEILSSFEITNSPDTDSKIENESSAIDSSLKNEVEQDKSNGKDRNQIQQSITEDTEQEFHFDDKRTMEEEGDNQITGLEIPVREKDLLSYLSRKEIKRIILNVFGGDDEDFVTSIEKISECGSYSEATEILKGTFFTYRISPYSKEAVVFTNAASSYFRQD